MTNLLSRVDTSVDDRIADGGIAEDLVCLATVPVTHDVTSFVLASPTGRRFAFDAGQYVTVAVTVDGQRTERCYTISSPSTQTDRITLTVKRVPGGPVSNWLHDRFRPGDRIGATGPLGRFGTAGRPARKYLFLSAGSGVTPLMSMTSTLAGRGTSDIIFVHSARSPRDIVFRAELARIAADDPSVRVTAVCEDDAPDETWTGPRGRLSLSLLQTLAPDLTEREVFTCGPQPYMDAVRDLLRTAGADPGRCHEESFVLGGVPVAPAPAAAGGTGFAVEFRRSGRSVVCAPGETVLQAGLRAGIALPSSCGEGMCGTCRTPLSTGTVDLRHNGGIRPREIAAGQILLCCSTPLDDVVVDA